MITYTPHRKAHRRWRGPARICRTTVAVQALLVVTVTVVVCGLLQMSSMGSSLLGGSKGQQPIVNEHEEQAQEQSKYTYMYTTLTGYFQQDEQDTDAATFKFMNKNFGLLSRDYDSDTSLPGGGKDLTQWQRFEHHVSTLNTEHNDKTKRHGGADTGYILLFLGRHGNGYHNVAERYYGNAAWDCHFSALEGDPDGIMTWSDAHLTKEGQRQAREVNSFWRSQISSDGQKMSLPEKYFVSPLDRTLETAHLSFEGLLPNDRNFDGIVMEKIREGTGIHTCDRRSTLTHIKQRYPQYNFDLDPHLTENDGYFVPDGREPDSVLVARLRSFFDELVDGELVEGLERISITSHSGAIGAMLKVFGHRDFPLATGAVIPVLVKVDKVKVESRRGGGPAESGEGEPVLDLPPLSSDDHQSANNRDWNPIPACPAGLDLSTVGEKRWHMGLKEYLARVENGTIDIESIDHDYIG
jgi:broad specificity phosphatase PhoE